MGLTVQQKQFILDSHNKERAIHCSPPLIWDTELEKMADYWANNCVFQHWANVENKPLIDNQQVGENMQADFSGGSAVISGMDDFIKEKYIWKCGDNTWSESTGHYVQMIWPSTTKIGCAMTNCTNGLGQFLVCEYSPIAWTNQGINTSNCFKNCPFVSVPVVPKSKPIINPVVNPVTTTLINPLVKRLTKLNENTKILVIIITLFVIILLGILLYIYLKRKKQ